MSHSTSGEVEANEDMLLVRRISFYERRVMSREYVIGWLRCYQAHCWLAVPYSKRPVYASASHLHIP